MELNQYQALAMRTAKIFPTLKENLIHAALGLGSEAGELALTVACAWMKLPFDPKNLPEEMGDACWYSAYLSDVMGWKFEDLILEPGLASEIASELAVAVLGRNPVALTMLASHYAGEVLTVVKAHAIYGKELDHEIMKRQLSLYVTTLSLLSDLHGFSFEEVTLKHNVEKLQKRYPDKYSDADALARADKAEPEQFQLKLVH